MNRLLVESKEFDYKYFNEHKSPATVRAVRNAGRRNQTLVRSADEPFPVRGVFAKYSKATGAILRLYDKLVGMLFEYIDDMELSDLAKSKIKAFEKFQSSQKGPVGPVEFGAWTEQVEQPFLNSEIDPITLERCEKLWENFSLLYDHFGMTFAGHDAHKIDFVEEWRKLPSTTVRGFPFNTLGRYVDDQIVVLGGSSFDSALKYFVSAPQNYCFTGVRIQGTPYLESAKVRMVSIPITNYQYINVGLVHFISWHLKHYNSFCGWNVPDDRDSMIVKALQIAEQYNCTIISMDYSKFDRCCNFVMRKFAYSGIRTFFSGTAGIDKWFEHQNVLSANQFLMFTINGKMTPTRADNLLLSGVIDTQLTGSLINLCLQIEICKQLGSPINIDAMLALGDDVGLMISNELIERWSYKGLLQKISEIIGQFGFFSNVDKAYPNSDLVFLQRLYNLEAGVIGLGSYARTLNSWIWKERYTEVPEGILSVEALDLFSQIAMLSDVERHEPVHKKFRSKLADIWLDIDDGLKAIIHQTFNSDVDDVSNADAAVRLLIRLTTENVEIILKYFNTHGYDRYNLEYGLGQLNYGIVFNFMVELITAWRRGNYRQVSIAQVFGDAVKVDRSDSDDDFVKG